jgi:hypothetical protein
MRLVSFFSSSKDRDMPRIDPLVVDLGTFQVGSTPLGSPFPAVSLKEEIFQLKGQGMEIGCQKGILDYGFFTVAEFKGNFALNGRALALSETTGEGEILGIFGPPYWIDQSDGDTILFYEYRAGTMELQFEFRDGGNLGVVTLSRNGVLSDAGDRKAYGVDKPWPPP